MTSLNSGSSFLPATARRLLVKRNGHSLLRSAATQFHRCFSATISRPYVFTAVCVACFIPGKGSVEAPCFSPGHFSIEI